MTQGERKTGAPEQIGFLLIPQFSMMAFFAAVEPLRVANRLSGRELYTWQTFSEDGQPVEASNGMTVLADAAIGAVPRFPTVFVCASFDPHKYGNRSILSWLRRLDRQGSVLGGMDTGSYILCRAGLLTGHRVTLHWENLPGFTEEFPDIETTGDLFEIDGKRWTCSGGTAALDLMLHLISERQGTDLAMQVSEQLLHERIRSHGDHQRMTLGLRLGVTHPKLIAIVEAMEANVEEPLCLEDLTALGGLSARHLERLFRSYLGDTPISYYRKLRLRRARHLLRQTHMGVLEVATACGFVSAPYFSRAYRDHFGCSPRDDRRAVRDTSRNALLQDRGAPAASLIGPALLTPSFPLSLSAGAG